MNQIINDIDIREEKNLKNSKIYLKNVVFDKDSYETKILCEDNIDGVLHFQLAYEKNDKCLVFDVGDTISFEEYLLSNILSKKDICDIIISVDDVLTSIENYLISENSISLNLKLIRVYKLKNHLKLKFVVLPNNNSDFAYELSKFLIKVLRHIDTSDREALSLAYGLFVKSSKENYMMSDLMELVDMVKIKDDVAIGDYNSIEQRHYDEMMAEEIEEEMANYYYDYDEPYESYEIERKKEVLDNRSFDDKGRRYNDNIYIDDDTKDFLEDEIYEDFDKEDKKIIKFSKSDKKSRKRKTLNAHINITYLCLVFTPVLLVVLPVLYFLINGQSIFMKNIVYILIYELALFGLLITNRIKEYRTKNI